MCKTFCRSYRIVFHNQTTCCTYRRTDLLAHFGCKNVIQNKGVMSLLQVIHIFCVPSCQLLSYPLQGPHMQIDEVLTLVERETRIPIARQDLLLSSGMEVNRSKPAEKCIVDNLVSSHFLSRQQEGMGKCS